MLLGGKSRILQWGRNTVDITSSMKLKMGTKKEQLPLFSFTTIETATGCFAASNKLGQGGFGSVYKVCNLNGIKAASKSCSDALTHNFEAQISSNGGGFAG